MAIIYPEKLPPYAGELANPIPVPWAVDPAMEIDPSLVKRKIDLLAAHYGIDLNRPDAWQILALKLAGQHVPGFQFEAARPQGRPKEKTGEYEFALLRAVQLVSQKHGAYRAASRTAELLAEARVEHIAKAEGRTMSRHQKKIEIDKESRQIRNEISSLKKRAPK
jgi:hypothetical protein